MATNGFCTLAPDGEQRNRALQPHRSFLVQAPAGSGKTELLIQRYLVLLARVAKPEAIIAITFTKKAAGEMRSRVLRALEKAETGEEPANEHERITQELAVAALRHNQSCGWNLLSHPNRLRVQTIDSLCSSITRQMPWLARLGSAASVTEDAAGLYVEAARRTVLWIEQETPYQQALAELLSHLDGNASRVRDLLASMLARREQWLEIAVQTDDDERKHLEKALCSVVTAGLEAAHRLFPVSERQLALDLARYVAGNMTHEPDYPTVCCDSLTQWPDCLPESRNFWLGFVQLLLNNGGEWRKAKGLNKTCGFPSSKTNHKQLCGDLLERLQRVDGLLESLAFLRVLPPARYSDTQWSTVRALLACLKVAAAQLRLVFQEKGQTDFSEVSQAASSALGRLQEPSDLACKLDSQIEHLLIDEFQDTSVNQFHLLQKLVSDWQDGDGRTVFLVGDPMQSIYRFRQAEVSLFLQTCQAGIAAPKPDFLQLLSNYRSLSSIVDRINTLFTASFPTMSRMETGAISYSSSIAAITERDEAAVQFHAFGSGEE